MIRMTLRKSTVLPWWSVSLPVVHDLQEDVEQVRVRLLDLVEQQHAMRVLVDGVGEEPALVEADIARRRADQPADRVALHIFRHVEALERDAHDRRQLARHLGLADAGGAGEEVVADRLVGIAQARADSLIAEDSTSIALSCPNTTRFRSRSRSCSVALSSALTDFGGMRAMVAITGLDLAGGDDLLALGRRHQHLHRADLVDHVDRLVRQLAVVDVARRQLDRRLDRVGRVFDRVVLLEGERRPARIFTVSSIEGSLMSIFWKRRSSARSFSKWLRNSL
jgi:hypothetical protein